MKTVFVFLCIIVVALTQEPRSNSKKRDVFVINTGHLELQKTNSSFSAQCEEDDALIYARHIAVKLKSIEDRRQRLICEHLIDSSLFKASLGELVANSIISESTGDRSPQPYVTPRPYVSPQNVAAYVNPETAQTVITRAPEPPLQQQPASPPLTSSINNQPYLMYSRTGDIPPEERQRLRVIHAECEADPKTYVDEALLRKLRVHKENRQVQIHMHCMGVKAGLMTPQGTIDESFSKSRIGLVIKGEEAVNEVYRKCAIEKRNKEETITYFWLCLILEGTEYYAKI